jgi:hypothetical protein
MIYPSKMDPSIQLQVGPKLWEHDPSLSWTQVPKESL